MANIIEYLETEFATFEEKPFNAVDSLVLSEFCMARMEGIVAPMRDMGVLGGVGSMLRSVLAPHDAVHFRDVLQAEKFAGMFTGLIPHKIKQLVFALAASPRFRDVELREYASVFNEKEATQFAALSFVYKNQFAYLGFRGTDCSFAGWREDFNMAYMHPVPSQSQAVAYVEAVAPRLPKRLYLGGHSKGGNLAVYAGAKASERVRARIERIFSHDGPGFREGVLTPEEEAAVGALVDKTVPQDAVIGMLLSHAGAYRVVKSHARGLNQHDPFSWEVVDTDFEPVDGLTSSARFVDEVLDEWLERYGEGETRIIVDALFAMLQAAGDSDLSDLFSGGTKTLHYLKNASANATGVSKRVLLEAASELSAIVVRKALKQ